MCGWNDREAEFMARMGLPQLKLQSEPAGRELPGPTRNTGGLG